MPAAEDDAQVLLASRSPRRAVLLERIGIRFRVVPADVDERPAANETAADYVRRLAAAKAEAVAGTGLPVLGADTVVVQGERMLGKPAGRRDGLAMLAALSGRSHRVLTAVAVATPAGSRLALSTSEVWFRRLTRAEIAAYWDTGEGVDKAGGYGVQGIGGIFIERIDGSYSGVMGLPLLETESLLAEAGVATWRHRIGVS